VEDALATVSNWEFDAFHLADVTQGNPLSVLGFYLFHENHFISTYKLDAGALARWALPLPAGTAHLLHRVRTACLRPDHACAALPPV
jgi:hypothetical protein